LREGNECQGKSGKKSPGAVFRVSSNGVRRMDAPNKQAWTIVRRCIAIALLRGIVQELRPGLSWPRSKQAVTGKMLV